MNRIVGILVAGILTLLLAGCITSTTTGPKKTELNEKEAAEKYYQLGARYYRSGSYDLARQRLERALEYDPKMAMAHSTLALTFEGLDNPRRAAEEYQLAVKYAPNDFEVRNTYAVFLCRQREFDEAKKQFAVAVDLPNNNSPEVMLTNAGVCMSQKPDFTQAEIFFRQALAKRPDHGEALLQMTALKYRTDEYPDARSFLQRFLSRNKPNPTALFLGVQIEQKLGNEKGKMQYVGQLLRDFPDSAETRVVRENL
ncbi:MAG: type IV pilus biogenesis/stability protein PilW [Gammaproteobacteria bacterium]|nr:type IV pilus biogenesis/stability protein PilW [Gammaproteobacteria bacterium]MDH4313805.1 type IV pilus biogenesis/stability protein PilW [Gammaproteobacteria bacterium]MDH5214806.1 type IV pilus biogenesis/stability protein PilW [Gammaproteobacteria bacterium]MDH5501655.1 type IV pilus biogenesis/stability protein PilW [Gammaproteobacteria bacterium]